MYVYCVLYTHAVNIVFLFCVFIYKLKLFKNPFFFPFLFFFFHQMHIQHVSVHYDDALLLLLLLLLFFFINNNYPTTTFFRLLSLSCTTTISECKLVPRVLGCLTLNHKRFSFVLLLLLLCCSVLYFAFNGIDFSLHMFTFLASLLFYFFLFSHISFRFVVPVHFVFS